MGKCRIFAPRPTLSLIWGEGGFYIVQDCSYGRAWYQIRMSRIRSLFQGSEPQGMNDNDDVLKGTMSWLSCSLFLIPNCQLLFKTFLRAKLAFLGCRWSQVQEAAEIIGVVLETLAFVQKIMLFGFAVMIKTTGQALSQAISKFLCKEY